jgi:predicted Zn-dependent peptidase
MSMDYTTARYDRIGETLYQYRQPNGLTTIVIRKKGYYKKTALFATDYGSIDNVFTRGDGQEMSVPDGIAHFLEHKLFEQEDGSMLDKFSRLGSSPNAFTSFSQTVYYFSCTDLFEENFRMLLDYVQKPWITDENVEKEKGIIGQEILMYQDNPDWRVFFNLLDCLYVNHPIKLDIAGSLESISKITRDLLYDCYHTFYTPGNMVVVVAGDVEPDAVFTTVDNMIQSKGEGRVAKKYPPEPASINQAYREDKMRVSMPLFNMGVKDNELLSGYPLLKKRTAIGIILAAIMGRSSELFNKLYYDGLINDSFRFDISLDKAYGFVNWGGQSADPAKTAELIRREIASAMERGLDRSVFDRIKKSHEGLFIRGLNSSDSLAREIMDSYFNDAEFLDLEKVFEELDLDYANALMRRIFSGDTALSVISPI